MRVPPTSLTLCLLIVVCALCNYLLMWLSLRPWRQAASAHWTERARWLWMARKSRLPILIGVAAIAVIFWLEVLQAELHPLLPLGLMAGYFSTAFIIDRRIEPRHTLRLWLGQLGWILGFVWALAGIVIWVSVSTSVDMTRTDWLRLAVAAVLLVLLHSGVWLLLLPNRGKHPETPRLRQIVDAVAVQAGVGPVRAWVVRSVMANAIALMYIRSMVFTSRAMEVLDDAELRTIAQHEMAHLRESVPVRCARMLGGLSWLGFAFTQPVVHRIGYSGVFWIFIGVVLVRRFAMNIAKRMENRADSMSTTTAEEGPVYARALEKLYKANQMPAVMPKRLLHPHLYDRMTSAGLTPDYPRPSPPPKWHWTGVVALLPLAIWLGYRLKTGF